jgi:hypothetical protein
MKNLKITASPLPATDINTPAVSAELLRLQQEKQILEEELRSRDELMASLFAYIESAGK